MRLLCFPYAGASAMVYQRWRRKVPAWLEVRPMEMPGRGSRLLDPLPTEWNRLVTGLALSIADEISRPYALFGHSLGALVAFEVAHRLRASGLPPACALIVSAAQAPGCRDRLRFENLESDEQLCAELRRLNGTDALVFASEELMALTLPVLRADFNLCAQYRRQAHPPLHMPLHVLAGSHDEISEDTLLPWQEETEDEFSLDYFPGDHFFIQSSETAVLATLCRYLQRCGASGSGFGL